MTLLSMTGYASSQMSWPETEKNNQTAWRLGLEIRSVNSRFLDLSLRLPDVLRRHEPALRELILRHVARGKIELRLFIEPVTPTESLHPSVPLLQHLSRLQDQIQGWLPHAAPLSVAEVLQMAQTHGTDVEIPIEALLEWVKHTIVELNDARRREGKKLTAALELRTRSLNQLVADAQPLVEQSLEQQQEKFLLRWQQALNLNPGQTVVDESQARERALAEITAFAVRTDISEEITRLQSHLQDIERWLQAPPSNGAGKRLDFLIQELHREANTLGSKSTLIELSRLALEMKVLIEQMREQVQNLE